MKRTCLLILLCLWSVTGFAQTEPQPAEADHLNELVKLEFGLHGVGFAYEMPLSSRFLVDFSAGLGMGYAIQRGAYYTDSFKSTWILNDPAAYLKSDVRYIYNREKRLAKGKSLRNNTGNYLGFQAKYTTRRMFNNSSDYMRIVDPLNRALLSEVHWGMQRPLGENFLFNLHLGLGYAHDFDFNNGSVYPALGVRFNYILLKKDRQ